MLGKFPHHQLKHILAHSPSEELCATSLVCPFSARDSLGSVALALPVAEEQQHVAVIPVPFRTVFHLKS